MRFLSEVYWQTALPVPPPQPSPLQRRVLRILVILTVAYIFITLLQKPFTGVGIAESGLQSLIERENLMYKLLLYIKSLLSLIFVGTFIFWSCVMIYDIYRLYVFCVAHIPVY